MRTQIKKYLTICLLAFAFTMEAATKNFLKNQEKISVSTQTVNKVTAIKNKKHSLKSRLRSDGDTLALQPSKNSIAFIAAASATVVLTKKHPIKNSTQPSKSHVFNHSRVKPHLNRQKRLLMTYATQLSSTETKVPDEIRQDAEKDHTIQGKSEDQPKVIREEKPEVPKDITEEKYEDLPKLLTEEKSEDLNNVLTEEQSGAGDEVDIIGIDSEDLGKVATDENSEDLPKIIKEEKSKDLPKLLTEEKSEDLPKLLTEEKFEDLPRVLTEEKKGAVVEANIIGTEPAKLPKDIIGTDSEDLHKVKTEEKSEDLPKLLTEEKSEDLPRVITEEKSEDLPRVLPEEKSEDLNKVLKEEKTGAVEEANRIGTEPAKLPIVIIGTEPENINEAAYIGVTIRKSMASKISKNRRNLI